MLKTMKQKLVLVFAIISIAMVACLGHPVEVPAAHVGKVMTDGGFQEGIKHPSTFKLETSCKACDTLVLAETSDYKTVESFDVFMPQDELFLTVEVSGTYAIASDETNADKVFSRVTAEPTEDDRVKKITAKRVYDTYVGQVVETTTQGVLTRYTIEHVLINRDAINTELQQAITDKLEIAPIKPILLSLTKVEPPPIIVQAQALAKEREIEIKKAEADKEIAITKANAALEVAEAVQEADLVEAETQVLVNQLLAESVSDAFVTQRSLRILQSIADNDNAKVILFPTDLMDTIAGQNQILESANISGE